MAEEEVQAVEQVKEKRFKIKGGLIKADDGTEVPTKMFDILELELDDYSDLDYSLEQVRRMRMHAMKMRTGIQAMAPALCLGPVKCPFRMRCPIVDRTKRHSDGKINFHTQEVRSFPLMRQCPFERDFIEFKRRQYMEEFDIDVESPSAIDMGMINKLAELDLYEYRATLLLANGDDKGEGLDLLKDVVTSVSPQGDLIMQTQIHPAFELKEKLQKQRDNILQSMVGTRREKYKKEAALKRKEVEDPSTVVADLRARMADIDKGSQIIDAEFTENEPTETQPEGE